MWYLIVERDHLVENGTYVILQRGEDSPTSPVHGPFRTIADALCAASLEALEQYKPISEVRIRYDSHGGRNQPSVERVYRDEKLIELLASTRCQRVAAAMPK